MSSKESVLKLLGFFILLVGFASAALLWRAQDRLDQQNKIAWETDATAPLQPDDSRRYTHDAELYYGKTGLLMDKWTRWSEGLTRGKSLAITVGALSLIAAGGSIIAARLSKNRP